MKRLSKRPVEKREVYTFEIVGVDNHIRAVPGCGIKNHQGAQYVEITFLNGEFLSVAIDQSLTVISAERDKWHLNKSISEKIEELEVEYEAALIRDYKAKMNRPVAEDEPNSGPDTYKTIYD